MSQAITTLRKYSILIHRWMGVGFCVLFVVWFISGIVMMYWYYPSVDAAKRLARSAPLDASRIQISPQEAYARLELGGSPSRVHINMLDGRPVYRFHYDSEQLVAYADDGEVVQEIPREQALRIASAWTGRPASEAEFRGLLNEADQWTVSGFAALRPLFKYAWPDGEEVYVSQVTGEVVQHTTRGSRIGAYFGAIPHWLYFTPLRKDAQLWNSVVVWSSGIGTVMTIFGIVVGIWLYSPSRRRFRFPEKKSGIRAAHRRLWRAVVSPEGPSSIPYAGQKRWHTMLGLIFGLFACTWAFSGMLSMSPFEWLGGRGSVDMADALRGAEWRPEPFSAEHPRAALTRLDSSLTVKEIELAFFAGKPVYLAREAPQRSLIIPAQGPAQGAPQEAFDQASLVEVISKAAQPHTLAEVRVVREYEAYYIDRDNALPLPALFVRLNDSEGSMYYVDLRTGRVVQSYGAGGRWNRWLYHGLHSFDLPWLYRYRPAWDIAVLFLMLGGTALCVTSVIIGWRRLRRKVAMRSARSIYTTSSRAGKELSSPPVRAGR
jgi:hypothetical protein